MQVWIVYLEDEPGFVGVFDNQDDAYEYQEAYAADSGRSVLLTPVAIPYREHAFNMVIRQRPAADN